jgi:hypothetical protein
LRGAIAAIAVTFEDAMQINQKVNIDATIRRDLLTEAEVSGVAAKIAFLQ